MPEITPHKQAAAADEHARDLQAEYERNLINDGRTDVEYVQAQIDKRALELQTADPTLDSESARLIELRERGILPLEPSQQLSEQPGLIEWVRERIRSLRRRK